MYCRRTWGVRATLTSHEYRTPLIKSVKYLQDCLSLHITNYFVNKILHMKFTSIKVEVQFPPCRNHRVSTKTKYVNAVQLNNCCRLWGSYKAHAWSGEKIEFFLTVKLVVRLVPTLFKVLITALPCLNRYTNWHLPVQCPVSLYLTPT